MARGHKSKDKSHEPYPSNYLKESVKKALETPTHIDKVLNEIIDCEFEIVLEHPDFPGFFYYDSYPKEEFVPHLQELKLKYFQDWVEGPAPKDFKDYGVDVAHYYLNDHAYNIVENDY